MTATTVTIQNKTTKLFGTDGIRGKADRYPFDDTTLKRITRSFAIVLEMQEYTSHEREEQRLPKVVIGRDTRASGKHIEEIISSALSECDIETVLVGVLPTPAIAFATRQINACAGIMISASHNPADDNGIKFFGPDGYKIPDATEEIIEKIVHEMEEGRRPERRRKYAIASKALITTSHSAEENYINHLKRSTKEHRLDGLTVVLDAANGAAQNVGILTLESLGAEVNAIGADPDGMNINKGYGSMHPEMMMNLVRRTGADAGISLDGDADRVIMCDSEGNLVDGDRILAIAAIEMKRRGILKNDTVVGTVMTNTGFDAAMKKYGIKTVKTAVGDKYVIECMQKDGHMLGGEQSGHIIFGEHATTGDGILTALQILTVMKQTGKPLSTLADVMETYPQVLINVPVMCKPAFETMPDVQSAVCDVEDKLAGSGRVLLRYSGTENKARVMVEAKSQSLAHTYAQTIAEIINRRIGA